MFVEKRLGSPGAMSAEDVAVFVKGREKHTTARSEFFVQDGWNWMIECAGCQGRCVFLKRQLVVIGCIGSLAPDTDALDVSDVPDGLTWEY